MNPWGSFALAGLTEDFWRTGDKDVFAGLVVAFEYCEALVGACIMQV